jgi:hypothetical protein
VLSTLGFFISWVYLRFYKPFSPDLSVPQPSLLRGDASETFAFAYFFPDPLHGPVASISDKIYGILVALKVCTPFSDADIEAGNNQASSRNEHGISRGSGPAAGSARAEAERRRALALKVLDQRLHAATNKAHGQHNAPAGSSMLGETNYTPEEHEESRPN